MDRVTVGRHPGKALFLPDVTVSLRHAVLVRAGGTYRVEDCGSVNGTYVNRELVSSRLLEHGDELQIGKYKLAYLNGSASAVVRGGLSVAFGGRELF